MVAAIMMVFLRPTLSIVNPPLPLISTVVVCLHNIVTYISEPKNAPPENVALMAPIIGDVFFVPKKTRKLGDRMTIVITPESYPKRKLPVPAKMARAKLKKRPIAAASDDQTNGQDVQ